MLTLIMYTLKIFAMEAEVIFENHHMQRIEKEDRVLIPGRLTYDQILKKIKEDSGKNSIESIISKEVDKQPYDQDIRKKAENSAIKIYVNENPMLKRLAGKITEETNTKTKDGIPLSFFNMIRELEESKKEFTINLFTFGDDGDKILNHIEEQTKLKLNHKGEFKEHTLMIDGKSYKTFHEIYKMYSSGEFNLYRADHGYWKKNENENGKLFITNKEGVGVFLDDNAYNPHKKRTIIAERSLQEESKIPNLERVQELIAQKAIVNVNLIKAIVDPNYFIDYVTQNLKNEDKRIILFVDINGTILMEDKAINMSKEDYAEKLLLKEINNKHDFFDLEIQTLLSEESC
jgi:hypothetical protein